MVLLNQVEKNSVRYWASWAGIVGFLLCMASLPISAAGLSIGTVVLVASAFFAKGFREQLRCFAADQPAMLLGLFLVGHLLSIFWTEDWELWVKQCRIRLPLLLAMFALTVHGPFPKKILRWGLFVLLLSAFVSGTATAIDYFLHKEQMDLQISVSKPLKIYFDINHIYFSILLAFSIFGGIWLWLENRSRTWRGERLVLAVLILGNFFFLHLLTARTGLVAFYLACFSVGLVWLLWSKKYLFSLLLVVGLGGSPFLAYHFIPSLQHRIDNTLVDLQVYQNGGDPNFRSLATRLESWEAAWHIFQDHPWTGVGSADLRKEMAIQYQEGGSQLCQKNFILPHSQFLITLAGQGAFMGIWLLVAWFWPVLRKPMEKSWLFFAFWVIYSFGMLGESLMDRQIGVMFLVICFMLTRWIGNSEEDV